MSDPPQLKVQIPQLNVKIPQQRDLPRKAHKFSENFVIDFLLLTAVDCEFRSCFHYLQEPLKYYDTKIGFVYVGKMGDETEEEKLTIGLMKCDMGSGVGGSGVTVQNAAITLKPKGVFCVGFCGGMNSKKAKLGDVVVSAKLISYALQKAINGRVEHRGTTVPLGKKLNDIMRCAGHGWYPPLKNMEEAEPQVVCGTMLSGSTLVNSKKDRDKLLKDYPTAIAIEMEGEGVYAAAHNLQIEWVVVKGISNYADGTKDSTKDWQSYASMMSASLVAHVLSQPSIFKDWPRYDAGNLSLNIQAEIATSRNPAEQDLQKEIGKVDRHMKQMVDKAKEQFDLSSFKGLDDLHTYLVGKLQLMHISEEGSSIKINVTCRSLEILERLWNDYCSGHLSAVAQECLITEQVKEELSMETIKLKTTILKEDYLACRSSLRKISGSPGQSSARSSKKRRKRSSPDSVPNRDIREKKVKTAKKANLLTKI